MFSAGMFSGYLPGAGLSGAVFFFCRGRWWGRLDLC